MGLVRRPSGVDVRDARSRRSRAVWRISFGALICALRATRSAMGTYAVLTSARCVELPRRRPPALAWPQLSPTAPDVERRPEPGCTRGPDALAHFGLTRLTKQRPAALPRGDT